MKKLTLDFVREVFKNQGWVLLEDTYLNNKTKLNCLCENKHLVCISYDKFRQGHRCKICYHNRQKLALGHIKNSIESEGYALKSSMYTNSKTKLHTVCPKGRKYETTWDNWKKGRRCPCCSWRIKPTFDFVKESFNREGYVLLSTTISTVATKLKTICPNKHTWHVSWSSWKAGYRCKECYIEAVNAGTIHTSGWKGGVVKKDLPLYETYANKLKCSDAVLKIVQEGLEVLQVKCKYCDQVFTPSLRVVQNRLRELKRVGRGEGNFYCSENCKKACPTFRQMKYPKGFKSGTSREVQPELRKMVLGRDNYRCQICGKGLEEVQLHCHHITGVEQNPLESADIDNCITLCKEHHKQVHTLPGCGYNDLKCKE